LYVFDSSDRRFSYALGAPGKSAVFAAVYRIEPIATARVAVCHHARVVIDSCGWF